LDPLNPLSPLDPLNPLSPLDPLNPLNPLNPLICGDAPGPALLAEDRRRGRHCLSPTVFGRTHRPSGQYETTSLGPPKVGLTAAPVPSITDWIPPVPLRNTVIRSWNWTPEVFGAWNAIAFSIATPWSKYE